MRELRDIAHDFLAHRSVERDELVRLHQAERLDPIYLIDAEYDRLKRLLGVDTKNTVLYGLKKVLPKH